MKQTKITNAELERLQDKAVQLDNLFFADTESGIVKEWYFNSDSSCGGTILENYHTAANILKIAQEYPAAENFFGNLEGVCRQYNHDITAPDFESTLDELLEKQRIEAYSFSGTDENTMKQLVAFAKLHTKHTQKGG